MDARAALSRLAISGLFVIAVACSDGPTAPGPEPVQPPVAPPPVIAQGQGQVWLRSASPEPGGTLLIRDCTYDPEEAGPGYQLCAAARMIFDVEFETEIAHAAVTARFLRGSQLCAYGSGSPYVVGPFTAGSRAAFMVNSINLFQIGGPIACPLPAETTRLVVAFMDPKTGTPLLTREFAYAYTFVER